MSVPLPRMIGGNERVSSAVEEENIALGGSIVCVFRGGCPPCGKTVACYPGCVGCVYVRTKRFSFHY